MGTRTLALKDWKRWAIFAVWLIVLLISLRAHTPWRDEYQSWLVSTRTPDLRTFFDAIRYERHPPLLYVLQRSLITVVPTALEWPASLAIQTVTVPFTIGAGLILLFALGLPLTQASLLLFSPYLLREFGVISRCYALGVFFLLAAVAFGLRKRFPPAYGMLALGSLTHLLFSWICGAIYVLLALQDRRRLKDLTFWLTGLIFVGAALLQLPPAESLFGSPLNTDPKSLYVALRELNQALWGLEKIWQPYQWNTRPLATEVTVVLILPALWLIHRALDLRKFFWVCFPPLLLVVVASSMNTRSLGVAFFGFVACYILFRRPSFEGSGKLNPLTVFSFTAVFSTALWWLSWGPFGAPKFNFSGTREAIVATADQIRTGVLLIEEDTAFFTFSAETGIVPFDMLRGREVPYPYFKKSEYIYASANEWCEKNLPDFKNKHRDKTIFVGLRAGRDWPEKCGRADKIFSPKQRELTSEKLEIYKLAFKS